MEELKLMLLRASACDIMTEKPVVISTSCSVPDALQQMQTRRFRHLPVVREGKAHGERGKYGMVTVLDLAAQVLSDAYQDLGIDEISTFTREMGKVGSRRSNRRSGQSSPFRSKRQGSRIVFETAESKYRFQV